MENYGTIFGKCAVYWFFHHHFETTSSLCDLVIIFVFFGELKFCLKIPWRMLWVNPPVLYKANPLVHIPPSKDQNLEFLLIVGFGERCLFCFMNPVTVLISTPKKMLNIHTCLFERWLNFCLFVNKYFIPQNDVFWVPTTFFKFSTFWIRFQFLIIFGHAHPSTATWMKPFPAGMQ